MLLRDKLQSDPGFQYIIDALNLISAAGRRALLDFPFLTTPEAVNAELDNLETVIGVVSVTENLHTVSEIKHHLMCLHDSQGTVANLSQHSVINEVELFEVKNIAYTAAAVSRSAEPLGLKEIFSLPDLSDVFSLLDPDNTGLPHFYIYDSYHPDLPDIRKRLKQLQARTDDPETATLYADLFAQHNDIQHSVEAKLSQQLWASADRLALAVKRLAYIDLLFAKAGLASAWNFTRPQITPSKQQQAEDPQAIKQSDTQAFKHSSTQALKQSDTQALKQSGTQAIKQSSNQAFTQYKGLFNPRLLHRNQEHRLRYQPIDIIVHPGLCLITGANMAGKTVLLKTLGIAQLLTQFGMYVPAESATVSLVDDVIFSIGDEQNEMNGLSSFASEIIKISEVVQLSAKKRLLVLIDEPARTTNPVEGKAIVQALSDILISRDSFSLVTTHYSQLGVPCRRLRIAGFREDLVGAPLSPENINLFMDYSLVEDNSDTVPQEALRIATLLRCDGTLIQKAQEHLTNQQ
ncbi:MAG: hypothetical protein II975_04460 [Bacteroidales bacterium]|nr:hypothetical protein [Bacteroidales bacterium]